MRVDVEAYSAEFERFCLDGLQRRLRPYQLEPARAILASVLERKAWSITVLMARQAGKNELIVCLALYLALRFPGIRIGVYAPTLPQAADITMRRLKRYYRRVQRVARNVGHLGHAHRGDREPLVLPLGPWRLVLPSPETNRHDLLEFPFPAGAEGPFAVRGEGSLLGAHSAEKDAEKEGYTWDLIIYDEAQELDRQVIDEEISPTGSATAATEVFIGTPECVDCKFYDVIQGVKSGAIEGACFEYPHQVVAAHVPEYARFVRKKAAELGPDSVAFRTQYAIEWVQGLGLFFQFDLFQTLALPDEEFLSVAPPAAAALHPHGAAPPRFAVG
ncbi:MAG: hypothetical protein QHJ73_18965, partial [Armatimonadota bacterium]|nr:hypothetical protein [Armatimonadota bacterium]